MTRGGMTHQRRTRERNPRGSGNRLRDDLVAAAAALLDDGGEDALSMRAVTRAVGAAPQSAYLHFESKEALLWAVLRDRFADLEANGDQAEAAAGSDPAARLKARCLALCRYGLDHPRRYRLLLDRQAPVLHDIPLDELPGARVFRAMTAAVAAYLGSDDAFEPTTDLLACLHGAVLLRTSMVSFPWPPIDGLIDRAIRALDATTP